MIILIFVLLIFFIRLIEFYFFMKKIKEKCYNYDRKHVEYNPLLVLDMVEPDYHLKSNWSAFQFLYFSGPNPIKIFFTLKLFKIENIYNKDIIEKVNKYDENI